jgi:hypothetical protein
MVAITALGTTLAGSININSGQSVEFGQGVSVTAACDSTGGITLAPSATFINAANGTGTFNLGTIAFTGIDDDCENRVFTLKGYGNVAGSAPVVLSTVGSTPWSFATFAFKSPGASTKSSNINVGNFSLGSGSNGTIDVGFPDTKTASATQIEKFTLESSAN